MNEITPFAQIYGAQMVETASKELWEKTNDVIVHLDSQDDNVSRAYLRELDRVLTDVGDSYLRLFRIVRNATNHIQKEQECQSASDGQNN